ncbi:hypothetical protein [Kordiimonas sp. SCSIO 12610]|uniref:hypothetical protein n=1 Tax=Kordiimonas sp. SCSIO 12610 TaxID=2829597 RepID=UPI0021093646|nr:hypothetical protein [Kordiimonas sp. SCSIO 12610]UTW54613.1 hypothetical protein KFF44_12485 [Kordiimonas sp. SCSIO 12610]
MRYSVIILISILASACVTNSPSPYPGQPQQGIVSIKKVHYSDATETIETEPKPDPETTILQSTDFELCSRYIRPATLNQTAFAELKRRNLYREKYFKIARRSRLALGMNECEILIAFGSSTRINSNTYRWGTVNFYHSAGRFAKTENGVVAAFDDGFVR